MKESPNRCSTFYRASIALGIIALVIHSIATDQLTKGIHIKAHELLVVVTQQTHYTPDPKAEQLIHTGRILSRVGTAFIILSAVCVFVAIARREPGWYSVPLLLIFFDCAGQMLL